MREGGEWPLVGRAEELEIVVDRLSGGRSSSFVLGGDAGVGKTRLASDIAAQLAGVGWSVERIGATPASSALPFGAFARLLPRVEDRRGNRLAADLIADTVNLLRARARDGPLLLVVDDAHHLDQFSALVVHHLAGDGTVRLLLTIRSGERVPDPLPALWKDGLAERLDLQPLSLGEVASLLRLVLGGEVERTSSEALWRSTSGQPLLIHEVVLDGIASGALSAPHAVWQWRPVAAHGARLREVVAGRLGSLSERDRLAVELVALSEPLSIAVLTALAPDTDLIDLERRAVLRVVDDGLRHEARLWHPILAEVIRGEIGNVARRRHAAALAVACRDAGLRRRSDTLRVALLQLEGGDRSHAADLAEAAMEANGLPDHPLAERLARAAYDAEPGATAALALGEALIAQGKREQAEPVLGRALEAAGDDPTRARVAWDLAVVTSDLHGPERALAVLDRAEALVEDAVWRQVIEGHRIQQVVMQGRTKEALTRGEKLLASALGGQVRLRLVTSLSLARALTGRTASALDLAAAAVPDAFAYRAEFPLGVTWTFIARGITLLLAGELHAAETHVAMARAVADGLVQNDDFAVLGLLEGRLALSCGRASDAVRVLREAVGRLRATGNDYYLHWALAALAEAEALTGGAEAAARSAESAMAAFRLPGPYDGDAARALAWVAANAGERTTAIRRLQAAADAEAAEEQRSIELHVRHDAFRIGDRTQAPLLLALAAETDGAWGRTISAHVEAAQAGDGFALDEASAGFEEQGALLMAAEASAEAAAAHRGRGLKAREAASIRRSADLAGRCGPVTTPVLGDSATPVDLTRREREVVDLAVAGLANGEIAERLFLSVRTVEGHLLRACAKLGVNDRRSLGTALGR